LRHSYKSGGRGPVKPRVNRRIRAPEIRVISDDGEQLGIMTPHEALAMAEERGLDLVEVAPTAKPPVCRVMDYGKYLYQQSKKAQEAKRHQRTIQVKEVKFRPKIDDHDFEFKKNHVIRFLKGENKKIEDEMMALLEEEEKIRATLSTVEAETQQFLDERRSEIEHHRARNEELSRQLTKAQDNYRSCFSRLPDTMQEQYRKIKGVRGTAVCVVTDETCPGCSSILTPQFLNELKKRTDVLLCDNCGRMLVFVAADDGTQAV